MGQFGKLLSFVGKRLIASVLIVGAWAVIGVGLWFFDRAYPDIVPLWLVVLFGLPVLFRPWFFLEVFVGSLIASPGEKTDDRAEN